MFSPGLLLSSLDYFGIHFLAGEQYPDFSEPLSPEELLAGLTVQTDARMRLAIIATLLLRPEFSLAAQKVLDLTPHEFHTTFQLYYTAACYLQKEHFYQLEELLGQFKKIPDLFSEKLDLKEKNSLEELGRRHKTISGMGINWYGTYQHAARRVITRRKKEREWQFHKNLQRGLSSLDTVLKVKRQTKGFGVNLKRCAHNMDQKGSHFSTRQKQCGAVFSCLQ